MARIGKRKKAALEGLDEAAPQPVEAAGQLVEARGQAQVG